MNKTIILQAMIIGKRLQISDWKSKHNPHEVLSDLRFTDQLQSRRATLCWLNSPVYTQVILNSSAVLRHTHMKLTLIENNPQWLPVYTQKVQQLSIVTSPQGITVYTHETRFN